MAKTRVHELAKEFGVESKFVLEKFKEMGEFVKSASSTVELPAEMRFRKEYGDQLKTAATSAAPAEAPAEKPSAKKATPKPPAKQAEPVEEPAVEAARACRGARRGARTRGRGARRRHCRGAPGRPRGAGRLVPQARRAQGAGVHARRNPGPAPGRPTGHPASGQQPVRVQPGHGPSPGARAP